VANSNTSATLPRNRTSFLVSFLTTRTRPAGRIKAEAAKRTATVTGTRKKRLPSRRGVRFVRDTSIPT